MSDPTRLDARYVNRNVVLPYGLLVDEVVNGVGETYRLFHMMNEFLVVNGFERFESLILGNSLSGIISEFLVKNIAKFSATLAANAKVGGHPDLLPKGRYGPTGVLKGEAGIEVKASIRAGGWQGHNPEDCWLMVFRYEAGTQGDTDWTPLRFTEILCAELCRDDWSFSGRKGVSRRTPTASITAAGTEELRSNFLYRVPGIGVGKHRSILAVLPDGLAPLDEQ